MVVRRALLVWILWRAVTPAAGGPPEAPTQMADYRNESACQAAAALARKIRNVVVLRGGPGVEVFACLPDSASPEKARFE